MNKKKQKKQVIVAFSGGLDTTFCVPYLQKEGYKVITVTINTGGFSQEDIDEIQEKSKKLGAKEHITIDASQKLFDNFLTNIIWANYLRGGTYPICVSPERVLIAQEIAKIAEQKNITNVAHGSTGAGNDQIRFDTALRVCMNKVNIITPIRKHGLTRKEETHFLKKQGVEIDDEDSDYSINVGAVGTTIGGKETHNSMGLPPDEAYPHVNSIGETPKKAEVIKIKFKEGIPVELNGQKLEGVNLINKLEEITAKHGVGKGSHLGTTILGIKGRIVFEAGAMLTLIKAHNELEKAVMSSKQKFWKNHMGKIWGQLIHKGKYFDPVINDIENMLASSQAKITGVVKVKLHKGNIIVVGSNSPNSLVESDIANYGEENNYWNGEEARNYAKLYGLEEQVISQEYNQD